MQSKTELVEKELGVKLPRQYATFLETQGDYTAQGVEVYGLSDNTVDIEKGPCVIGTTKTCRSLHNLPHRFVVVHHTGIEDETICLDTENGNVYSFSRMLGNRKVGDSFDEWFKRDIIEYEKKQEEYRKRFGNKDAEIIDLDWMRYDREDS